MPALQGSFLHERLKFARVHGPAEGVFIHS